MKMDWKTKAEIEAAAKESPLAAIEMSIRHWVQLATTSAEEIKEGFEGDEVSTQGTHCALCKRYVDYTATIKCRNCPLMKLGTENNGKGSCCQEWRDVNKLRCEMWKLYYSPESVAAFQSACHDILSLLYECRRAEVAKAEPKKGWEREVDNIRISSTGLLGKSTNWPVRISMLWGSTRGMIKGEYGLNTGDHPGDVLKLSSAREIASAINELCDIIEASEAQKEGGK